MPQLSIGLVVGSLAIPRQILESIHYTHKALPSDDPLNIFLEYLEITQCGNYCQSFASTLHIFLLCKLAICEMSDVPSMNSSGNRLRHLTVMYSC